MPDITFSGLASGMNTNDIVAKLMAIEQQPLDRLQAQKTSEGQRLQAYGQLNTLLQNLKTAVGAMNLSTNASPTVATSGNSGVFTAVSASGTTGSYNISVSQLAQVQKSVSSGYTSQTDPLFGNGTLTVNGQAITIDDSNNSLRGIAQSLNAVADQTGVTASIINDGSGTPYRLVLTGKDASTNFTVESDLQAADGSPIPFGVINTQNAQQAKLNIDGIDVVSNSNTISGAIAGVVLNLTGVSQNTGTPEAPQYQKTSLNVTADTDALKGKITDFVNAYNAVMNWVSSAYTTSTDNSTTDSSSTSTSSSSSSSTSTDSTTTSDGNPLSTLLRGDATVNSIKRSLQSILGNAVGDGSFKILAEIGISTNRDGSLSIDSTKLNTALDQNFTGVSELLAGNGYTDGVMKRFNSYLLQVTSPSSGMYASKQTIYNDKVKSLDAQISVQTVALDKRQADLYARFSAMESLISNLNSASSYLTQFSLQQLSSK